MSEIRLQTVKVLEIDDGNVVCHIRSERFVRGAVTDSVTESDGTDGWNLQDRTLECRYERPRFFRREISLRLDQYDV